MKDIKSFCKMFDLNIPCFEEFEYYKSQFARLERWKNIDELVLLYEKAESEIGDMFQYRMKKIDEIIAFVKGTRAYSDMADDNLIPDYPTSKSFEYSEGVNYLSIDMKMANWQAIKRYDPDFVNELGNSYGDLLDRFGIPEVFKKSKHFRQYIFGNLSPKRQMKAQRVLLQYVIDTVHGLKLECVKHDEAVYSFSDMESAKRAIAALDPERFRAKAFFIEKADGFRINRYLCMKSGKELHSEPVGCSGHKFFMHLKDYVFREPYDERDLYFRMDGDLAVWKTDKLKIKLDD